MSLELQCVRAHTLFLDSVRAVQVTLANGSLDATVLGISAVRYCTIAAEQFSESTVISFSLALSRG